MADDRAPRLFCGADTPHDKTLVCAFHTVYPNLSSETVHEIVQTIADRDDTPPEQLEPPLSAVIDPDALTAVLRDTSGYVTFRYRGYIVTVGDDGTVTVEE